MPKLSSKAKSSKLGNNLKQSKPKANAEFKEYARSYRLDSEIMNVLKSTLDKVNEISPKKISETRLIKAIILLSRQIDEDTIIQASKEVW